MVNGVLHMFSHACDLALKDGNPLLQVRDGQWIEVLFGQERDRVARARKILFGIHDGER